jgi:hypothetical protein
VAVIESLMATADRDSVKLAAAQFIMERGYGKAVQMNENSGQGGMPTVMEHRFIFDVVTPEGENRTADWSILIGASSFGT